jgi:WD40 repeat protein
MQAGLLGGRVVAMWSGARLTSLYWYCCTIVLSVLALQQSRPCQNQQGVAPAQQQRPVTILRGHTGAISAVTFSPHGRLLASASVDGTVRIWDAVDLRLKRVLVGHSASVNSIEFDRDGRLLASASSDRTIRLWAIPSGRCIAVLMGPCAFRKVIFWPQRSRSVRSGGLNRSDGSGGRESDLYVATLEFGPGENAIRLWRVWDGREVGRLKGHRDRVNDVAVSPNGRWLASGSLDKTSRLWDAKSKKSVRLLSVPEPPKRHGRMPVMGYTVAAIRFSPDGRHLATAGPESEAIRLWDVDTGRSDGLLIGPNRARDALGHFPAMAFSRGLDIKDPAGRALTPWPPLPRTGEGETAPAGLAPLSRSWERGRG